MTWLVRQRAQWGQASVEKMLGITGGGWVLLAVFEGDGEGVQGGFLTDQW
ncbi:hypothetical protein [Streptosporangium sp. NPDC000396]